MLTLRCRSANGATVIKIDGSQTFAELKKMLEAHCGIPPPQQKILSGFPVTEIKGNDDDRVSNLFKSGDTLTIERLPAPAPQPAVTSTKSSSANENEPTGVVVRRIIPDDNSCLFNAVGYVLEGKSKNKAPELRQVVAQFILSDPDTYNEATLGKNVNDYVNWILKPTSWGGAIELSILSKYYESEIVAYDVINVHAHCFGEGNGYKKRVYVMYDGIHYDALALSPYEGAPESLDKTVFSPDDDLIAAMCLACVQKAHNDGKYTDTAKFQLVCEQCGATLVGEKGALEHVKATGHSKFSEKR